MIDEFFAYIGGVLLIHLYFPTMNSDISVLERNFRSEAAAASLKIAEEFSTKVDPSGVAIADSPAIAFFAVPAVINSDTGIAQTMLVGYFHSKSKLFESGAYAIRLTVGADGPGEDAEWMDLSGVVARRTKVWFSQPEPSEGNDKLTITSKEERFHPNGTISIFIDGTLDIMGHNYHFFLYLV